MSDQKQLIAETARCLERQMGALSDVLGKVVAEGERLMQSGASPQSLDLQALRDWRARLDMFRQELAATAYFDHLQEVGRYRTESLLWVAQSLVVDGTFNESITPRWSTVWQQEGASLNVDMELTAHRFLDQSGGVGNHLADNPMPAAPV
jgi:hypothetical protein